MLDIRKVFTDTSRRSILLAIRTWDAFQSTDVEEPDSYFVFLLDTKKRGSADKLAYMAYDTSQARFECNVFNRDGGFKGAREAMQLEVDTLACVVARSWFDIQKTPRFGVESYELGSFKDRAPNDGRYVGL